MSYSNFDYPFDSPNNLLFELKGGEANVLNSFLVVEDYYLFPDNKEAVFRVKDAMAKPIIMGEVDGKPIQAPHWENVVAFKLPFSLDDFGSQSLTGQDKFNGLIKAGSYVVAINETQVMVYNLDSEQIIASSGNVKDNTFNFTVDSQDWKITFEQNSPVGNIFTLTIGEEEIIAYTLMR